MCPKGIGTLTNFQSLKSNGGSLGGFGIDAARRVARIGVGIEKLDFADGARAKMQECLAARD